ncbi:MAG: hypothetical protein MOGMAGMI_01752 [Candidatus Omnitrophica bacterium]|nr:hypothetical protein [Candidatus Omnitrophota bacterium]
MTELGGWPRLGCGVGLRSTHYDTVLSEHPRMDWFEAITENFMDSGGRPVRILEEVRRRYPVALHGVSLSIGSADPLHPRYLSRLRELVDRIEPFVVSDHLCWCGVDGDSLHDLLPLPFTEEAIEHVVRRVGQVQELLGRPILIENVSSYVTYRHSTVPEWEFLAETARRSGCGILLDLNNVYVNSVNHGFDPSEYLRRLPGELVGQFHLAGHTNMGRYLFDTHGGEVIDPVWRLYEQALELYGKVSTLIEWDDRIPSFERLAEEARKAREYYERAELKSPDRLASESAGRVTPYVVRTAPAGAPALVETQRWLKTHIKPGARPEDAAAVCLNPQGGDPGVERLAVYAGGYFARVHEALAEVYESVRHLLGEAAFRELADAYAVAHPSREYNLTYVGRQLPQFLEGHPHTERLGFLPDLAALEWRVTEAFHAYDGPAATAEVLSAAAELDPERLTLEFQPSVQVFASMWPVVDLWQARRTPLDKLDIALEGRPQCALVYRRGSEVVCEVIAKEAFLILEALLSGATLGRALERLSDADEELPLGPWFADWSAKGLLTGAGSAVPVGEAVER